MTGERLAWFTLADRLGLSLQRCQAETTSTEFLEWQRYIALDRNTPTVDHFYLAQIAAESRRAIAKKPEAVKIEDFVLTFDEPKPPKPITEEEQATKTANSKAMWFALLGVKKEGPHQ